MGGDGIATTKTGGVDMTMIIHPRGSGYQVLCNTPGCRVSYDSGGDRNAAYQAAKAHGWTSRMTSSQGGDKQWRHYCPECVARYRYPGGFKRVAHHLRIPISMAEWICSQPDLDAAWARCGEVGLMLNICECSARRDFDIRLRLGYCVCDMAMLAVPYIGGDVQASRVLESMTGVAQHAQRLSKPKQDYIEYQKYLDRFVVSLRMARAESEGHTEASVQFAVAAVFFAITYLAAVANSPRMDGLLLLGNNIYHAAAFGKTVANVTPGDQYEKWLNIIVPDIADAIRRHFPTCPLRQPGRRQKTKGGQ